MTMLVLFKRTAFAAFWYAEQKSKNNACRMNINYQTSSRFLLSLIGLCSIFQTAQADPFIYHPRDLILGFRKNGGSFELEVNVGPASKFYTASPGSTFTIDQFTAAQLTDAISDYGGMQWSIGGTVRLGDGGDTSIPVSTLWVTRPRANPSVQSTPWNRQSSGALAPTAAKLASIGVNAAAYSNDQPPGPHNTVTAVQVESGN